jgi:hypothetical protein
MAVLWGRCQGCNRTGVLLLIMIGGVLKLLCKYCRPNHTPAKTVTK